VIDAVTRWRATALYCIPAVWERVLDPALDGADLSSLRYADTGTSPVAGDLVARIKSRLPGTTTTILYGSTEAGRMAALHDWELAERSGSVGRAAFPGSLTIAADGEVCVRTPALMDGYLGAPETTARVMSADGAYRTGDLGRLDDEGYLYLTGRTREVIRSGGEFVAPSEVEHVLALAPGVADVAVVGVPDDRWGEVVCAVVVPAESGPPSLGDLQEFARERLASHKLPRRLALVTGIPRTPATGQVQRSRLREDVLSHVAVRADG
jgi:acyl-CoA synthetase (AMP-forming)/AMP-acid ligase II